MEIISKISLAFSQGGVWMFVILGLQVVSIAIILERYITLYVKQKSSEVAFANGFEEIIRQGRLEEAKNKALAEINSHPIARAIVTGVEAAKNMGGKDEIQGKMDEVLIEENTRFEKRTGFLAMLANVGTLTGLLGTIVGMITSFSAVSGDGVAATEKAQLLSSGISVAMNTTAYGLIMAIPALVMFAILTNRANQLSEDLNQAGLKVFNWLSYAHQPVPVRQKDVN